MSIDTTAWLHRCEIANQDRDDDPPMFLVTVAQANEYVQEVRRQALVDAAKVIKEG